MRTSISKRIAVVVAWTLTVGCPQAARAGAPRAGTWGVEGTTTVSYDYEGHHVRLHQPFATRIVVHDDGTIDGQVIEPDCSALGEPVTFTAPPSDTGRAAFAAALRAFTKTCYARSRLKGVRVRVRVSDDGTRLHGEFRGRLRIPLRDADGEPEPLHVRFHGVADGHRDD
jgi:hypothetical protein